jgi:hypothetical protein
MMISTCVTLVMYDNDLTKCVGGFDEGDDEEGVG